MKKVLCYRKYFCKKVSSPNWQVVPPIVPWVRSLGHFARSPYGVGAHDRESSQIWLICNLFHARY